MSVDDEKNKSAGGLKSSNLAQAWLVLVLAVAFGVSLAGVQLVLGPVIEGNKLNETLEQVPELVLGKFLAAKMAGEDQTLEVVPRQVTVSKPDRTKFYSVYEARYQGDLKGWVVKTKGPGYADTIELLLGLSPDVRRITGVFVLDQKETPGLGTGMLIMLLRFFSGYPEGVMFAVLLMNALTPLINRWTIPTPFGGN
jgi:electron transport complex protein RnfG